MKFNLIGLLPFAIFASLLVQQQASAQRPWRARGPINRLHRSVGAYFSDGYHRNTPGPDGRYYNPYSPHNTARYHQNLGVLSSGMNHLAPHFPGNHGLPNPGTSNPLTGPNRARIPLNSSTNPVPQSNGNQLHPVPPNFPYQPILDRELRIPPQKSPSDDNSLRFNRPPPKQPLKQPFKRTYPRNQAADRGRPVPSTNDDLDNVLNID